MNALCSSNPTPSTYVGDNLAKSDCQKQEIETYCPVLIYQNEVATEGGVNNGSNYASVTTTCSGTSSNTSAGLDGKSDDPPPDSKSSSWIIVVILIIILALIVLSVPASIFIKKRRHN
jgi:hypothetical protein